MFEGDFQCLTVCMQWTPSITDTSVLVREVSSFQGLIFIARVLFSHLFRKVAFHCIPKDLHYHHHSL